MFQRRDIAEMTFLLDVGWFLAWCRDFDDVMVVDGWEVLLEAPKGRDFTSRVSISDNGQRGSSRIQGTAFVGQARSYKGHGNGCMLSSEILSRSFAGSFIYSNGE